MIILLQNEDQKDIDQFTSHGFVDIDGEQDIDTVLEEMNNNYPNAAQFVVYNVDKNKNTKHEIKHLCCLDTIRTIDCEEMTFQEAIHFLKEEVIQFITDGICDGFELGENSVKEINFLNKIETRKVVKYRSLWAEMEEKRKRKKKRKKRRKNKKNTESSDDYSQQCSCGFPGTL